MLIERGVEVASRLAATWREPAGGDAVVSASEGSAPEILALENNALEDGGTEDDFGQATSRALDAVDPKAVWQSNVNEHSIKLLEILNELLSGVTGKESEVGKKVSDLYVFLCQHLLRAEDRRDPTSVDEIRLVLETEAETWRMVCAQEKSDTTGTAASEGGEGGLDLCG